MGMKYPNGVYISQSGVYDYVQDGRASSGFSPNGLHYLFKNINERNKVTGLYWSETGFTKYVVAKKYAFTIPENFVWWE